MVSTPNMPVHTYIHTYIHVLQLKLYNAFGFEMSLNDPVRPADGLDTETVLVIVFGVLSGVLILAFMCLEYVG